MDNTFVVLKTGPAGSPDEKKESFINFWKTGKIDFLRKLTETEEEERVLEFARNFHFEIAYDALRARRFIANLFQQMSLLLTFWCYLRSSSSSTYGEFWTTQPLPVG